MENNYEQLNTRIADLETKIDLQIRHRGQLDFPLDVISKKIITDIPTFPVVASLPGTQAQSAQLYGYIFSADRPYLLDSITESHGTVASNGTLQFVKVTGNKTIATGSSILSTTFDLTAVAGTARIRNLGGSGGFSTAQGITIFNTGDRLGMQSSGTLASLQDLQVTAYFKQI